MLCGYGSTRCFDAPPRALLTPRGRAQGEASWRRARQKKQNSPIAVRCPTPPHTPLGRRHFRPPPGTPRPRLASTLPPALPALQCPAADLTPPSRGRSARSGRRRWKRAASTRAVRAASRRARRAMPCRTETQTLGQPEPAQRGQPRRRPGRLASCARDDATWGVGRLACATPPTPTPPTPPHPARLLQLVSALLAVRLPVSPP